jgi:hypothetical protein
MAKSSEGDKRGQLGVGPSASITDAFAHCAKFRHLFLRIFVLGKLEKIPSLRRHRTRTDSAVFSIDSRLRVDG